MHSRILLLSVLLINPELSKQVRRQNIHSEVTSAIFPQLGSDFLAVLQVAFLRDRKEGDLIRRKTKRKSAIAMLDKYSHKPFELFFIPPQSLPIHKWHDESARAFQNPHSHFDISVQISLGAGHRVGSCRTGGTCRCCPGSTRRSWGRRTPRLPPLQSTGRPVHPEWSGAAIPSLSTPHSDRQTMGDARKEPTRPWAEWRAQTSS